MSAGSARSRSATLLVCAVAAASALIIAWVTSEGALPGGKLRSLLLHGWLYSSLALLPLSLAGIALVPDPPAPTRAVFVLGSMLGLAAWALLVGKAFET